MEEKAKRKLFLFVAILLTACVLSLAVLNLLVLRPAKRVFYGKDDGIECEVLCCTPQYKTLKQALIYGTYYRGNYAGEVRVKIDKSFGKVYNLSIDAPGFSLKSKEVPTGRWVRLGSYALNSNLITGKAIRTAVSFYYDKTEKSGYGTDYKFVTMDLKKRNLLLPRLCKPGFVPTYP